SDARMEWSRCQPSSSNVQGLARSCCKTHTKETPSRHTPSEMRDFLRIVEVVTNRGGFKCEGATAPPDRPTKKTVRASIGGISARVSFFLLGHQAESGCVCRHPADSLSSPRRVTSHGVDSD